MNNDIAIIFLHLTKDKLTSINYQSIIDHSSGVPVYTSNQYDYPKYYYNFLDRKHISEWTPKELWFWGCDNLFLYWYLSNPTKRYKQYLLIEHDTYACENILDFLNIDSNTINNNGITAINIKSYLSDKHYWWFDQFKDSFVIKRTYGLENLHSCTPICCNMISDDAVQGIIKSIQTYPEINKVFSEIKFATILSSLRYNLSTFDNNNQERLSNYITYDVNLCEQTLKQNADSNNRVSKGVYHPIKNLNKIYEYLQYYNLPINNLENITQALYGVSYNALPTIQKLYNEGKTHINVNNALCGDPAAEITKTLKLNYIQNNKKYTKF